MVNEPDIIFFGGTFDPPHEGHVGAVRLVLQQFPAAKLLIVPALIPASAGIAGKLPKTEFSQRVRLCELAFAEFGRRVEISRIESTLPIPNYSITTIGALQVELPEHRLGMMIGMDQFEQFLDWKNPSSILASVNLIVVGRPNESDLVSETLFEETEKVVVGTLKKLSGSPTFKKIWFLAGKTSRASSSELRQSISGGSKIPEGWLNPDVENYIREKNIYVNEERR